MSSHDGHYAFIPKSTLLCDAFKSLSTHTKVLFAYFIAEAHGRQGGFTYPYKEIRKQSGFRYEMIRKAVREMEATGIIEYEHGGLEQNANVYTLNYEWIKN